MRITTLVCLTSLFLAAAADAQTITVTTRLDKSDVPQSATLASLPGPDGVVSLREAILVSNNLPGVQVIGFAIPQSDWPATTAPEYCAVEGKSNWNATDTVLIDASTQTAFTGDTNPDGGEIALYSNYTLYLRGDGSILVGLHHSTVYVEASNCLIQGNTGGISIETYLGAGNQILGNDADTIELTRSHDNVIAGNTVRRIRISGVQHLHDLATNNRIGGPGLTDRNFITGWGNYESNGKPNGDTISLIDTRGTIIENNYIGTTSDGMAIGNVAATVGIRMSFFNQDVTIRDNLIATRGEGKGILAGVIYGDAVYVDGPGSGLVIQGNTIGLDALGQPTLAGVHGIEVQTSAGTTTNIRIGGDGAGEANVIAGHQSTGVFLKGPGSTAFAARVSRNSFFANGEMDVDLTPNNWTFGPTLNDALDLDIGANGLQNYPDLTQAQSVGASTRVTGTLASEPQAPYTLEFFASPSCNASGVGPGQVFLGATTVSTDAVGVAGFDVMVPASAPAGWVVTATATREPEGKTSEFSACVPLSGAVCQADLGFGGPGAVHLTMCGDALATGGSADLKLTGGPALAPTWFLVGLSQNPTPALGGTLVPVPVAVTLPSSTDANGERLIAGVPGGGGSFSLYAQAVVADAGQPLGYAISNALRIDFQP